MSGASERLFELRARDGGRLVGVVHEPAGAALSTVVLGPSGLQPRAGLHRSYVRLSRALQRHGHRVVRADLSGIGEAEGDFDDGVVFDQFDRVERGMFLDDYLRVLAAARATDPGVPLVAAGICGGGITALYAADREPAVAAAIGIGVPMTRTNRSTPAGLGRSEHLRRARRELARLRQRDSGALRRLLRSTAYAAIPERVASRRMLANADEWLNTPLVDATLRLYRAGRPVALIYGDHDLANGEPDRYLIGPHALHRSTRFQTTVLDGLAHSLDAPDQVDRLVDAIAAWLAVALPEQRAADAA